MCRFRSLNLKWSVYGWFVPWLARGRANTHPLSRRIRDDLARTAKTGQTSARLLVPRRLTYTGIVYTYKKICQVIFYLFGYKGKNYSGASVVLFSVILNFGRFYFPEKKIVFCLFSRISSTWGDILDVVPPSVIGGSSV